MLLFVPWSMLRVVLSARDVQSAAGGQTVARARGAFAGNAVLGVVCEFAT